MSKFYVTRGKIAIKEEDPKNETSNGIIYKEKASKVHGTGVVSSIGLPIVLENGMQIPIKINEGDRVIFDKSKGYSTFGGLSILDQDQILGVFGETD
jgi:co-chaperonin GroES (HSP10)